MSDTNLTGKKVVITAGSRAGMEPIKAGLEASGADVSQTEYPPTVSDNIPDIREEITRKGADIVVVQSPNLSYEGSRTAVSRLIKELADTPVVVVDEAGMSQFESLEHKGSAKYINPEGKEAAQIVHAIADALVQKGKPARAM